MRGLRSRLALALVSLVVVTVAALGAGTYVFVESRLRDGLLDDASRQAQFNLSVLVPERLPDGVTREGLDASGLAEAFRLRGDVETIVDFGDGRLPWVSNAALLRTVDALPGDLRSTVAGGHIGFAWLAVAGEPSLVVGGRPANGPAFYFVVPATSIAAATSELRIGILAAAIVAIALALATAGLIARGILRPVDAGSTAAARIAAGDLTARVDARGADELARWAAEFNRMADSLAATMARLEESESRNRRFVAEVSHELRTPVTALVAEASLIEAGLDAMPANARRAAELLVADVRRLRVLVDDLMELSRFDARAERAELEPVDLGSAVRAIVATRLPGTATATPADPVIVPVDVRRLDRIVGNLLDNARDHAGRASVSVTVDIDGADARVRVADRGPGVEPAALEHLFDRFYKADPSRHGGGSGLGLAIAAEHAALLGGSLAAANRPEGGLEVTLRLPVTGSLPERDGPDSDGAEPEAVTGPTAAPGIARPNA